MDAKRIIPILRVHEGKVLGALEETPADAARRLELGGADGILFLATGRQAQAGRTAWIRDVARALFLPFAVTCSGCEGPELEETLAAGADSVLLTVGPSALPDLARAAQRHGRNRLRVAVDLTWTPENGWRDTTPQDPLGRRALEWMTELGQMGAGELLLSVTTSGASVGDLCQKAAHLALPVLVRTDDRHEGLEAMLHGADGWACTDTQATPSQLKASLGASGLLFRR